MSSPRPRWTTFLMPTIIVLGIGAAVLAGRVDGGPTQDGQRLEFFVLPDDEAAAIENPHELPLCQRCHPDGRRHLSAEPVALCEQCHDFDHGTSHPVHVFQQDAPDPAVPLWGGSEVVCHSCHDPHDLGDEPGGLILPFNTLCQACHFPGTAAPPP